MKYQKIIRMKFSWQNFSSLAKYSTDFTGSVIIRYMVGCLNIVPNFSCLSAETDSFSVVSPCYLQRLQISDILTFQVFKLCQNREFKIPVQVMTCTPNYKYRYTFQLRGFSVKIHVWCAEVKTFIGHSFIQKYQGFTRFLNSTFYQERLSWLNFFI